MSIKREVVDFIHKKFNGITIKYFKWQSMGFVIDFVVLKATSFLFKYLED